MKCPNCRTRIPNDSVFCPICDFRVSDDKDIRHGLDETLHEDYDESRSSFTSEDYIPHHQETIAARYSCVHTDDEVDKDILEHSEEDIEARLERWKNRHEPLPGSMKPIVRIERTTTTTTINGKVAGMANPIRNIVLGIILMVLGGGFLGFIAIITAAIAKNYIASGNAHQANGLMKTSNAFLVVAFISTLMRLGFIILNLV